MIVIELIYNLSVLVALSVLSGFLSTRFSKTALTGKILQGLLFGVTAIIGMLYPFNFAEGIIFDGRSIVISLCALFFGPLSGSIAAIMAAGYRMSIGGGGAIMGVLVILSSFLIGYFFYNYRSKKTGNKIQAWEFYVLGIIVHIFMLLFILTLPSKNIAETYKTIALTIIGIYPLVTVLIGRILLDQEQNQNFIDSLRANEEKYRMLLDFATDAFFQCDQSTHLITVNNKATELTGYTREELLKMNLKELFPQKVLETNPLQFDLLRSGKTVKKERTVVRKNGNLVDVEMVSKQMPDRTIQSFFRDITELKDSEKRFTSLVRGLSDMIIIVDGNGKIFYQSPSVTRTLGYTETEMLGRSPLEFVIEEDKNNVTTEFKEVMTSSNSGIPTLYNVYCKDGSQRSIETVGVNMLDNPAVNGVVLFSRDVTARLKASLLEKENAQLFEDLIIKNTEPILILSFEGKILFANPACYKLADIEESSKLNRSNVHSFYE